jgi:NAD(P)-dependent dehydrogenase (short-subunit alcohol dehydrogenase family)
MDGIAGSVALVTGGNTGIGAAVSTRLVAEGARVAIGYVEDPEAAEGLAARLSEAATGCIGLPCDVTDPDSVGAAVERTERELGAITILVNNAGVLVRDAFVDIDEPGWDRVIQVSLYGSYRCAHAVVPGMVRQGAGTIVNVASELVDIGGSMHAHYVAAKSGVVGLTRALARELGPNNIRVNAVAPGPTDTRMVDRAAITPEYLRTIPLGRIGRPEDVAGAVAFLCGIDAAWITGQVLRVNGGLTMG